MENKDLELSGSIQDLLKTINRKTNHYLFKAFADKDLTLHQLYILKTIKNNPDTNFKALGNCLNLAKSSVSLMINKLVEEGYVEKLEDLNDRRNKIISLTDKGKEAIEKSKQDIRVLFKDLIKDLSVEDIKSINNSLILLNNIIEKNVEVKGQFLWHQK